MSNLTPEQKADLSKLGTARRLCDLLSTTNRRLTGYDELADCFCTTIPIPEADYRNDGTALAFIEAAVEAALKAAGK